MTMRRAIDNNGPNQPKSPARGPFAAVRRAWQDQRGVAAVEFAFVVPILVMIFAGITQFGLAFFLQGNMGFTAREVARSLAIGEISTNSQAQTLADSKLSNWGVDFDVNTTFPDPNDPNNNDYTVVITAPLSEASIIDILGIFGDGTLSATASMREET